MIPTHPCTAWCNHPDHIDLVHAATAWTVDEIAAVTRRDYARLGIAISVDSVEPASEAQPSPEPRNPEAAARPGWLVRWHLTDVWDAADPVGVVEIAERLGVTRKAVDQWRVRGLGFPSPTARVGGRPAWRWDDVDAWARSTGRSRTSHPSF